MKISESVKKIESEEKRRKGRKPELLWTESSYKVQGGSERRDGERGCSEEFHLPKVSSPSEVQESAEDLQD